MKTYTIMTVMSMRAATDEDTPGQAKKKRKFERVFGRRKRGDAFESEVLQEKAEDAEEDAELCELVVGKRL